MKENFDDLIPANFDGDKLLNSLEGLEQYEKFEVEKKKTEITTQAKGLVESLLKVYFKTDILDDNTHLKAIASLETSNLIGLIESARYAQHAVSTLMRKIDAGMHAEMSIYPILIDLQKNALDIQMKVANYSRTLSPYLKSLKEEIDESDNETIEILSRVETDSIDDGENSGSGNFRGTLEMNKYFQNKLEEINKNKEKRKNEVKEKLDSNDYSDFEEVSVEDSISKEEEEEEE